jgi:hypothetical protein
MRRFLAVSVVVLGAGGALFGAAASASSQPRALLRDFQCQRALDPGQRQVSVSAVMRPLTGTKQLQLRFQLLSKPSATAAFTEVHGNNLGNWETPSDPSLGTRPADVWMVNHPVADLPAPDIYRFVVTFRWIGDHHSVLGTTTRETHSCFEPELRPDLAAVSFTAQAIPAKPKHDQYSATIADDGLTGAGPFDVEFAFGTVVRNHTVKHIAPHQSITMQFIGPLCDASSPPTMTIDPAQQVDDYNRSNNSISATCPATTPMSGS